MAISKPKLLDKLLAQEMNRREFLTRLGATGLALVGITGLLKTISGMAYPKRTSGYGATPYGGKDKHGASAPYEETS